MFKKIVSLIVFCLILAPSAYALGGDIEVQNDGGIYVFKIPIRKYKNKIRPYVAKELTTVSDVYNNKDLNFKLVVNGGFFDPVTGAPVSNVIINEKNVQSMFSNLPLVEGLNKQNRVEKVLNRSELRILKDTKNRVAFDIVNHFFIPDEDQTIVHSIQAGPMIIPEFRLEEESFVTYKDRKAYQLAADVLKRRERTIIGLKNNPLTQGDLYIIIFTSSKKATLNEARDYCLKLGLDKALAMDGGASTSINYGGVEIFSDTGAQRKVKSFLVIEN